MKKDLLVLFTLIMIFPMFARAQSGVTVKSIEKVVEDISTDVEELTPAKAEGLVINVDVKFKNVNDKIKYKVVVENKDKEDYQLNTGKKFKASEFITYTYEFDNGSNILKASTTKTMYVTLTYTKEVPDSSFVNGEYIEDNEMSIGVLREEDNPQTGREEMVVIGIVLALIIVIGIVMVKNRQQKYLVIALGTLLVIVPTVKALKEVTITMNTKIKVQRDLEFCIYNFDPYDPQEFIDDRMEKDYLTYLPGETTSEYDIRTNQNYDIRTFFDKGYEECVLDFVDKHPEYDNVDELIDYCSAYIHYIPNGEIIKHKSKGCYMPTPN